MGICWSAWFPDRRILKNDLKSRAEVGVWIQMPIHLLSY